MISTKIKIWVLVLIAYVFITLSSCATTEKCDAYSSTTHTEKSI
jgi:hypothetical protein